MASNPDASLDGFGDYSAENTGKRSCEVAKDVEATAQNEDRLVDYDVETVELVYR
jgi:hypothetical protein